MPPCVSADVARHMEREGRPWMVRVEYDGVGFTKTSRQSGSKWWEILGNGSGVVQGSSGKGSRGLGTSHNYMVGEALEKLRGKLAKGYKYAPDTATLMPHPREVSDLPEPYRRIKRIIALGDDLFRALDKFGNVVMDLDREGKEQLTMFNPWIVVG
jgi:hypothetical protein